MCPFVVFIYANKFAWRSGMGDGNQGKTKHISMSRQRTGFTHARPAFIAGVQTMRARICSAFSCAMFARVVWLKLWGAAKLLIFALSFAARTHHALLLATNSYTREEISKRGESSL